MFSRRASAARRSSLDVCRTHEAGDRSSSRRYVAAALPLPRPGKASNTRQRLRTGGADDAAVSSTVSGFLLRRDFGSPSALCWRDAVFPGAIRPLVAARLGAFTADGAQRRSSEALATPRLHIRPTRYSYERTAGARAAASIGGGLARARDARELVVAVGWSHGQQGDIRLGARRLGELPARGTGPGR